MATLQDALDAVTAAKTRVDTDIAALQARITELEAAAGTPAVDLQPVVDAVNAIDPAPVIVEPAPAAPSDATPVLP